MDVAMMMGTSTLVEIDCKHEKVEKVKLRLGKSEVLVKSSRNLKKRGWIMGETGQDEGPRTKSQKSSVS